MTKKTKQITLWSLALMITGGITSIRNFASSAKFGPELIFFFIAAALLFLIPVALISAQLSSRWNEDGGAYFWASKAMGKGLGFLAIWLQWINTMAWYPTMLAFIAGLVAYMINPSLTTHPWYLISIIFVVFWSLTIINLYGVQQSSRFAAICTVIGLIIPLMLIIALGYDWVASGKPMQIHLSWHSIMPHFNHMQSWIALTSVIASYVGIELACVHIDHVKNPRKTFPRALTIAVMIIIISMILGSLTIAAIIPMQQISLITGVMQAFDLFLKAYHLQIIVPWLAVMLFIGSLGGMINWIISPAKGLLQAAQDGLISTFWTKTNKHGVAYRVLIAQALLVSAVCLAFLLIPDVNGAYWLLLDLTSEMYLIMYVLLLLAGIILCMRFFKANDYTILRNRNLMIVISLIGLVGCVTALVVGFFPPKNIAVGSAWHYEILFIGLLVLMMLPGIIKAILIKRKAKKRA